MNKSTFEHEYGRSCFMGDENTDDLRDIIKRYRNKVINLYFKNKKFAWDSSTIKALKDDIKKILIERQKNGYGRPTCAYCRQAIQHNGTAGEIDHILYKSKYINLIISPYNLILSCANCNGFKTKGSKDLLDENVSFDENEFIQINKRDETIDKYNDKQDEFFSKLISPNTLTPNNGTYLWVHPYYDEYFECVTIIRDGNALLYSANEDADDEQRKKAIKMIEELGFYKGGRNVTLPEKEITLEKNKAIEGNYMVTISDCE